MGNLVEDGGGPRVRRRSWTKMALGILPIAGKEVALGDFERGLAWLESHQVFGKIIVTF